MQKKCRHCKGEIKNDKYGRKRKVFCNQKCFIKWIKTPTGRKEWRRVQEINIPLLKKRVGELNPAFKGDKRKKTRTTNGYIQIPVMNHPFGLQRGRMISEHRFVMEEHLKKTSPNHIALTEVNGEKYLARGWVIHHKNGKRDDNRIENLELYSIGHHIGHDVICPNCGYLLNETKSASTPPV